MKRAARATALAAGVLLAGTSPVMQQRAVPVASPAWTGLRSAGLAAPTINLMRDAGAESVVDPSVGVPYIITHDEHEPGTGNSTIRYTVSDVDAEQPELPSCGQAAEEDTDNSEGTPPTGEEYPDHVLHFCGADKAVIIRTVLCRHDDTSYSNMSSKVINARRYEPPPPLEPVLEPADSACQSTSSGLACTLRPDAANVRVALAVSDEACSNPAFASESECENQGGQWRRMPQCSEKSPAEHPCMDIFYTVDESDPAAATSETRHLYNPVSEHRDGLPLEPGEWTLRAVVVRSQRRFNKRSCKCCCQKSDCHVIGAAAEKRVVVTARSRDASRDIDGSPAASAVAVERNALAGSPDITMVVDETVEAFTAKFYGDERLQWRSGVASALGLYNHQLPDFRRIQGSCECSQAIGCKPTTGAMDICIEQQGGEDTQTRVTFYITAAGLCVGGRNHDLCVSNTSCGNGVAEGGAGGYCEMKAAAWMRAYDKLQSQDAATLAELRKLNISSVTVSRVVDVSMLDADLDVSKATLEAVAAILVVVVLLGACYLARGCLCRRCMPAAKSAGKQVVLKMKATRSEARAGRHGKFQRMSDDDVGLTEDGMSQDEVPTPASDFGAELLWPHKKKRQARAVGMTPLQSLLPTSQIMAQPFAGNSVPPRQEASGFGFVRAGALAVAQAGLEECEAEWLSPTVGPQPQRRRIGVSRECVVVAMQFEEEALKRAWACAHMDLTLFFENIGHVDVTDLTCKAAVPKYMHVQITPPSTSTLPASTGAGEQSPFAGTLEAVVAAVEATQTVRLSGISQFKPVKLRLKLEYAASGEWFDETFEVNLSA